MSPPASRLQAITSHILHPFSSSPSPQATNIHQLSPTFFLPRAAEIEPEATAIYHVTANNRVLRRSYIEFADRARGLAYFLMKHGFKRVGILAPNTPAFLESIFGIAAAGGINVAVNYRLKMEDISYIFEFGEVDSIIVDAEYVHLLDDFRKQHPSVPFIVDTDTDATAGQLSGPFDEAVLEGLGHDEATGSKGWEGLKAQCDDENAAIAIPFTSGTTAKPKGVVYTHRAFPWAVTAVRGTHYCLRKIDYPLIWTLLKDEKITHFNAAPTVNTILCASKSAVKLEQPVRVTVAASPPTAHLFEQMTNLNLFPVHVYGLTETYGPITKGYHMPVWETLPLKEKYARMARQGHGFITALPIRVVKTEQPEGVLIDVKKDGKEIGEIVFLGNICAKEYFKDPEATRKLFDGGVLHSGDLAVWHADGSTQILDRAKDIIISGGENISSVALEAMLVQNPDVLEAGVVSVPDSHWGERPKAFITVQAGKSLTGEALIAWAKNESSISKFMVPREVEVVDELPKTSTGKLKKNVLRAWAKGDRSVKLGDVLGAFGY
ncbi:putative 2-succinylbenzoate-CoA ligase [Venustampulla echinocandica]|uniref:Putative 2-succinylbenzoate-CoA ligase n=1 Tax=Venustampulla echinocandica TaxID=2656787 RepID=A0A370TYN9_9HELO|nr:putative 2-succinylbenzoate-CoA ligase [Venustampulla echinocandica]RDL40646.1 putative 2-succinylbenzoate-CoA ligase [Venustampulla echinocandica]